MVNSKRFLTPKKRGGSKGSHKRMRGGNEYLKDALKLLKGMDRARLGTEGASTGTVDHEEFSVPDSDKEVFYKAFGITDEGEKDFEGLKRELQNQRVETVNQQGEIVLSEVEDLFMRPPLSQSPNPLPSSPLTASVQETGKSDQPKDRLDSLLDRLFNLDGNGDGHLNENELKKAFQDDRLLLKDFLGLIFLFDTEKLTGDELSSLQNIESTFYSDLIQFLDLNGDQKLAREEFKKGIPKIQQLLCNYVVKPTGVTTFMDKFKEPPLRAPAPGDRDEMWTTWINSGLMFGEVGEKKYYPAQQLFTNINSQGEEKKELEKKLTEVFEKLVGLLRTGDSSDGTLASKFSESVFKLDYSLETTSFVIKLRLLNGYQPKSIEKLKQILGYTDFQIQKVKIAPFECELHSLSKMNRAPPEEMKSVLSDMVAQLKTKAQESINNVDNSLLELLGIPDTATTVEESTITEAVNELIASFQMMNILTFLKGEYVDEIEGGLVRSFSFEFKDNPSHPLGQLKTKLKELVNYGVRVMGEGEGIAGNNLLNPENLKFHESKTVSIQDFSSMAELKISNQEDPPSQLGPDSSVKLKNDLSVQYFDFVKASAERLLPADGKEKKIDEVNPSYTKRQETHLKNIGIESFRETLRYADENGDNSLSKGGLEKFDKYYKKDKIRKLNELIRLVGLTMCQISRASDSYRPSRQGHKSTSFELNSYAKRFGQAIIAVVGTLLGCVYGKELPKDLGTVIPNLYNEQPAVMAQNIRNSLNDIFKCFLSSPVEDLHSNGFLTHPQGFLFLKVFTILAWTKLMDPEVVSKFSEVKGAVAPSSGYGGLVVTDHVKDLFNNKIISRNQEPADTLETFSEKLKGICAKITSLKNAELGKIPKEIKKSFGFFGRSSTTETIKAQEKYVHDLYTKIFLDLLTPLGSDGRIPLKYLSLSEESTASTPQDTASPHTQLVSIRKVKPLPGTSYKKETPCYLGDTDLAHPTTGGKQSKKRNSKSVKSKKQTLQKKSVQQPQSKRKSKNQKSTPKKNQQPQKKSQQKKNLQKKKINKISSKQVKK